MSSFDRNYIPSGSTQQWDGSESLVAFAERIKYQQPDTFATARLDDGTFITLPAHLMYAVLRLSFEIARMTVERS